MYEEGALIFPAVKVQQDYENIDDIIRMCRMRIRVPEQWWGDYLAMLGAARIGERELLALGAEVGWGTLHAHERGIVRLQRAANGGGDQAPHARLRRPPEPARPVPRHAARGYPDPRRRSTSIPTPR